MANDYLYYYHQEIKSSPLRGGFMTFKKGCVPWNKGKLCDEKTRIRLQSYNLNRVRSKEAIEKHKETMRQKENDPNRSQSKTSAKCRKWIKAIKDRDHWICQNCGLNERRKVQAHHIIPWDIDEKLRFELSNGISLCISCHMKIENKDYPKVGYWKGKKLSSEHKQKMSLSHMGKSHPDNKLRYKNKSWIIDSSSGKRKWIDK